MKKLLAVLLLSVATLVGCATASKPVEFSHDEMVQLAFLNLRQNTVRLEIQDTDGNPLGTCSAFILKPQVVLTAAHCDAGGKFMVKDVEAVKVRKDESKDLMLLFAEKLDLVKGNSGVTIAKESPVLDEHLVIVGYPLGLGQYVTEGRMQGVMPKWVMDKIPEEFKERFSNLMLTSVPVIFGNSGGPAFALEDGEYKLVGIVSAMGVAGGFFPVTHISFVVKTEAINKFLDAGRPQK